MSLMMKRSHLPKANEAQALSVYRFQMNTNMWKRQINGDN